MAKPSTAELRTAFNKAVQNNDPFYAYAVVTLTDQTRLYLDSSNDFEITGNSYTQKSSQGFPIGQVLCKTIQISIDNHDDRYSEYNFDGCSIILYTEIGEVEVSPDEDEEPENNIFANVKRINEGVFTVVEPVTYGESITMTAYDKMYKTDVKYDRRAEGHVTPISAGDTLEQAWINIATYCGLTADTTWMPNDMTDLKSIKIGFVPKEATARDIIGYIATLFGANAMIINNKLSAKIWAFKDYDYAYETVYKQSLCSGGKFNDDLSDEDYYSGGDFTRVANKFISEFNDPLELKVLNRFNSTPTMCTSDAVITGVRVYWTDSTTGEETSVLEGSEGYVIEIKNNLKNDLTYGMSVTPYWLCSKLGTMLIGQPFRTFSGSFAPDPTVEFMDLVYIVDRKDNVYPSFITGHTFNYLGASSLENTSPTPERKNQSYSSSNSVEVSNLENNNSQNSPYQVAVEALLGFVAGVGGFYKTVDEQADGSYIYYFHDAATLATSTNIVKISASGIFISNNGDIPAEYTAGVTINGDAVLNSLAANHISANYIEGGTLTLGGYGDTYGTLEVRDSADGVVLTMDNYGLTAEEPQGTRKAEFSYNGISLEEQNNAAYIIIQTNGELEISNSSNNLKVKIENTLETYDIKFSQVDGHTPAVLTNTKVRLTDLNGQVHDYYIRNGILCTN